MTDEHPARGDAASIRVDNLRYPGYDAAREVERLRVEMKRLETENEHLRDQLANCKGQLQAKAED